MQYSNVPDPLLNISHIYLRIPPGSIQFTGNAVTPSISAKAERLVLAPERLDIHPSSRSDA